MTISELLDAAKRKQGSLGIIAARFGFEQSRLSAWRSGRRRPDASEIMMLAEMAELAPLETLAMVELEISKEHRSVWERALGNLRAAGIAATVIFGLLICSMMPRTASAAVTNFVTLSPVEAAPVLDLKEQAVYLMSSLPNGSVSRPYIRIVILSVCNVYVRLRAAFDFRRSLGVRSTTTWLFA